MQIKKTQDGSHTVFSEQFSENYHSTFGARAEALHVYISAFKECEKREISVLEVGFGTGLNALLTHFFSQEKKVNYVSYELFPVGEEIFGNLNYANSMEENAFFQKLHLAPWNEAVDLSENFRLTKMQADFTCAELSGKFDVVYFDAFSPATQPELWTQAVFEKVFAAMNDGGIFATYCAKGAVRRALQSAGFVVERREGPKGKREILFGRK